MYGSTQMLATGAQMPLWQSSSRVHAAVDASLFTQTPSEEHLAVVAQTSTALQFLLPAARS